MKSRDMTRILIHEAIAALTDTTNTKLVSVNLEKISFGVFMFVFQNSLMFNPLKKKEKKKKHNFDRPIFLLDGRISSL